ncbi:tyrosine-type recombinase/integrase [Teichococcus vastitatis]|uniref:tyrosine-type recombinase/integrase n=1 Tax=Teichococcus vastitatis TaxID=2307076 RepID=UPI000E76E852|nr:tyrosine-type recombinase/integrase [Pseudoroseomonas vastitatis]
MPDQPHKPALRPDPQPWITDTATSEARRLLQGPVGAALAEAARYAGQALSANTRRAYASDWAAFAAWCAAGGVPPLPAAPVLVAGHLASLAGQLGRSGLWRRLAAIGHAHRQAGLPWEPRHPAIRATLRGILGRHGVATRPAAALTSAEVKRLLDACGSDMTGLRDKALLLVGFAGALRRSEIVGIDREHLRFTADGMTLEIPRSKGDQDRQGARIGIPRGLNPLSCPVRAMETWLARARIEWGAVFPSLTRGGRPRGRLRPAGVRFILHRRAERAGLVVDAAERLSPHGLRAGFITEAYLRGALDEQVMHHTRQKTIATTQAYRRRARITRDSPARLLDL